MAALTSSLKPTQINRRRRVRHHIQTPAYASIAGESQSAMLDLNEIVNISEDGVAIQCPAPMDVGRTVNLCLDLAECSDHIYTTGTVIWSNDAGRTGILFSELRSLSVLRLREWLFLNAMAGAAHSNEALAAPAVQAPIRPNYTDTLAAVTAVQREVEAVGPDLAAALQLIAARAQALVRASGAAVALAGPDPQFMVCRASSGPDAPPAGARLQLGSGFSGECVATGKLQRCDDTESDPRVDRDSCRDLGLRSMVAVPVRVGEKPIGLLEVFSAQPMSFNDNDSRVLQRLAETVLAAVNRAARAENLPLLEPPPPPPFAPAPGSVLFAAPPAPVEEAKNESTKHLMGVSLPRSLLVILVCAAIVISAILGFTLAPWIQSDVAPWIQKKLRAQGATQLQSVMASSQAPATNPPAATAIETASLDQLRRMAESGDAGAQNSLGLRYVNGEGVKADEREAARWFTKAAEQGYTPAQSKLGSLLFRGRETCAAQQTTSTPDEDAHRHLKEVTPQPSDIQACLPQNLDQAYFWMALARANGDENSKVLAPLVAANLTRGQVTAIELEANRWLLQHQPSAKPGAGH